MGRHELPEKTWRVLPLLPGTGEMPEALGAAWEGCRPCQVRWRGQARRSAVLVGQALTLWLAMHGTLRYARRQPVPEQASGLVQGALGLLRPGTRRVLEGLELREMAGPDGYPAAVWEPEDLVGLLVEEEVLVGVWDDALDGLVGGVEVLP